MVHVHYLDCGYDSMVLYIYIYTYNMYMSNFQIIPFKYEYFVFKFYVNNTVKKYWARASLVAQWLRICLPMQGTGFKPWSGKIPHAAEQLALWATTTEPARLEPVLRNKRGRDNERPAHRDEEWPPLAATRESPRTETKTQHRQK